MKLPPFRIRHFQMHHFNEIVWISIKITLRFVSQDQINNVPALVQIMAWRQAIIWTNDGYITDTYMRHSASMS